MTDKNRITFLTNGLFRTAGTEKVIIQLADTYSGINIVVPGSKDIAFKTKKNLNINSINIKDFPSNGKIRKIFHRIRYLFSAINQVKNSKQVVSFSFDLNIINIVLSKIFGYEAIVCEHIEYYYHKGIRNRLRKFFYRFKNVKLISLTETDKKLYQKDNINVECIPNFIPEVTHAGNIKSKIILAIGRLTFQKNFSFLIESFYLSKLWEIGYQLIIVGEGEEENILLELINKLKLDEFVKIEKFTKNIEDFYQKAEIFCMTSRFEAFPMVLLEAMNYALPVLLTNFPTGALEILGNDKDQILFDSYKPQDFGKKLFDRCNESHESKILLSRKNKNTVSKFYPENIIKLWDNIFIK
ncbi:hypothetical protein A6A19_08265 [Actinobacillus delphinicola]|uniref:glycosyltransferase n=1 Tax=Actinobacillus delphinicola TaxID=51161 RepID=UPI002441B008|nr:glycosyltransferase [Actinobacillus delphinicola]MDG6897967.1 hypothetical protein [Actinobacillus delphinicola]